MATPVRTASRPPARQRGAESAHTDEAALDLVAAVARAAAADPAERVAVPEQVSMRAFDRVKRAVDRDRGITDPDHDRTPTAPAIHLRFNNGAARAIT